MESKVRIRTGKKESSELQFSFAESDPNNISGSSADSVLRQLVEKAKENLQDKEYFFINNPQIVQIDRLDLKEVATFINLKGSINGMFVIDCDEQLARCFVRKFIIDKITPEEEIEYMEDILAEISNIILGNTIKAISRIAGNIAFEAPITIRTKNALCDFRAIDIRSATLRTNKGEIGLHLLLTNKSKKLVKIYQ